MSALWKDITGACSQIYGLLPGVQPKEVEKIIVKEVNSMMQFNRGFVRLAGMSGALSVVMAAYGAHGKEHKI